MECIKNIPTFALQLLYFGKQVIGDFMEDFESIDNKGKKGLLSKSLRAGKRTYFFDLKEIEKGKPYLIITESKRRFNAKDDTFFYEKHKVLVVKENVQSFYEELGKVVDFIKRNPDCGDAAETQNADSWINSDELE